MRFSELVREAHATACEKGWHDGEERTINRAGALMALIHSEVVEVEMSDDEHAVEELADVVIRLADAAGFFGWEVEDFDLANCNATFVTSTVRIHYAIAHYGTESLRREGKPHPRIAVEVAAACESYRKRCADFAKDVPSLLDAIKDKMAYNKTRSFRHGGKLL